MAVFRLLSAIFLLVLQARSKMVLGYKEKEFFTACPPCKCGKGGPEIRYPFRLQSSPLYCGAPGLVLSCSGKDTFLSLQESGTHRVIAIDYSSAGIIIKLGDPWANGRFQDPSSPGINLSSTITPFNHPPTWIFTLVNCSKKWDEIYGHYFRSMISCLSNADHFVYVADASVPAVWPPSDCTVVSNNLKIPFESRGGRSVNDYVERGELTLSWDVPGIKDICQACEVAGGRCEFNPTTKQAFCSVTNHPGFWNIKIITGESVNSRQIFTESTPLNQSSKIIFNDR